MKLDEQISKEIDEQISTDELRRMNFDKQMYLTNVIDGVTT